jgi:hypothetical protein
LYEPHKGERGDTKSTVKVVRSEVFHGGDYEELNANADVVAKRKIV